MTINRKDVLAIILQSLQELGDDLGSNELREADENTRLFGARSTLDSINLVNFIADVEDRLSEEFGIDITLANQNAMSMTHSPFRKVSSCVDYTLSLIEQEQT